MMIIPGEKKTLAANDAVNSKLTPSYKEVTESIFFYNGPLFLSEHHMLKT